MSVSITALEVTIAIFCQIKDPKVSIDYKIECISWTANCCIVDDGQTNKERIEYCKQKWNKISGLQ